MELKKEMFSLKKELPIKKVEITEADSEYTGEYTKKEEDAFYQKKGFVAAGRTGGDLSSLEASIKSIIEKDKKDQSENEAIQKTHRMKTQQKISDLSQENESKEKEIKENQENLSFEEQKIAGYKEELHHTKKHPEEITHDPASRVSFIIGLVILFFLTIYLFVFYSSASYSAFFKSFEVTDLGVAKSIFDAQALSAAWNDGATELILILTIPFVFLGLGYLIHKFQEGKNYIKVTMFIIVTFIFDCILAYGITKKIYDIEKGGSFDEMPDFSPELAAQNVDFWTVIFSGFLVYIIWGFVFDFVMDAYAKLDKVSVVIKQLEEKIVKSKQECKRIKEEIRRLQNTIDANKAEIDRLNIEMTKPIFYIPRIISIIRHFFTGWVQYLSALSIDSAPHQKVVNEAIATLQKQ